MADHRRGEPGHTATLLEDTKRPTPTTQRPEPGPTSGEEAETPRQVATQGETVRVRLSITTRRIRLSPDQKREEYVKRLEKIMRQCDTIVTNPNGYEGLQIRAMNVLIRAIQVCYKVVNDIEVEKLEQELEEIEREEKAITGEKGPGYRLDEDPTP